MSGRHEPGDATGWKRGAKGIDGIGKPIAPMNKQRFERDIPGIKGQAATQDRVVHNKGPGRQPAAGTKSFKSVGIDRSISTAKSFKRFKDWS